VYGRGFYLFASDSGLLYTSAEVGNDADPLRKGNFELALIAHGCL